MLGNFSTISNLSVTTSVAVDYFRWDFCLKGIYESKHVIKSASGFENNMKLTK